MAELYNILKPENTYYDRKHYANIQEYSAALQVTTTVYVGNLSFYTTQDSIRQLFSLAGKVTEIIMGIDDQGHPCGFSFVIFQTHEEAAFAVQFISKTKLFDRIIRVDWDPGYKKGREKGRGLGGQQKRDDYRTKQDAERPRKKAAVENRQTQGERNERYGGRHERERTREKQDYNDKYRQDDRGRDHRKRERQYRPEQERPRTKESSKRDNNDY